MSGILLSSRGSLELRKVLSKREVALESVNHCLEAFKLFGDFVEDTPPFLLETIVLFEASSNLTLVFTIVVSNLRLSFLVDFNLESTLARPLHSQVLIKLLNTLILEGLAFLDAFLVVDLLFCD